MRSERSGRTSSCGSVIADSMALITRSRVYFWYEIDERVKFSSLKKRVERHC